MKIKIIVLIVVFITVTGIAAGNDYRKAYLILSNNDTIYGYIEKKSDLRMSVGISFIRDLNSDSVYTYDPCDIDSFTFTDDNEKYKSVKYLQKSLDGNVEHIRIAKLIYANSLYLYRLELPMSELDYTYKKVTDYAYVLQMDTCYYTLTQYEMVIKKENEKASYYAGSPFYGTRTYSTLVKDYIGTLKSVFNDCPEVVKYVADLRFNDKEIIKVIKMYMNCNRT